MLSSSREQDLFRSGVDFIKVGHMGQSAEHNRTQRLAQNEHKAQVRLAWNMNLYVFHNKNMKGRKSAQAQM